MMQRNQKTTSELLTLRDMKRHRPKFPGRTIAATMHTGAHVRFQRRIRDARTGKIVWVSPWEKNLIMDQGLDQMVSSYWAQATLAGIVGTGTEPVLRDSGATTFTRAADVVTASANFFEAADVGRLLKFDTGEEMYIIAFTDAQNVQVDTSGALGASEGTVWYVDQTSMDTESKRTTTYAQNSGDNSTTWDGVLDEYVLKRTFLFSAEVGTVTYREVGWSPSGSAGANIFGRAVLPGAGDTLLAGQQYEIACELRVRPSPNSATAVADVGSGGYDTAGNAQVEYAGVDQPWSLRRIASNGTMDGNGLSFFDLAAGKAMFIQSANWTPTFTQSANNGSSTVKAGSFVNLTAAAYTNGTFTRTYSLTYGVSSVNGSGDHFGVVFTWQDSSTPIRCFSVKFTAAQSKDSDHTLSFVWRMTWGRILTN